VGLILVPAERVARWVDNFVDRHGETALTVQRGALTGEGADGSTFAARLPFETAYDGPAEVAAFVAAVRLPERWGVLLVRKGGFAVARLAGVELEEHKIGQRHVQGRSKAGGQSQQRFARRRSNQARQAYEAAAEHAVRILGEQPVPVVAGGDHAAVDEVLAHPRLCRVVLTGPRLAVPGAIPAVLDTAIADAGSVLVDVTNV